MIRLLTIELKKLLPSRAFQVLTGLYTLLLLLTLFVMEAFLTNMVRDASGGKINAKVSIYSFPDIWHNITYAASFFSLIPAILVITFITNEYSYRTIRQNIIDGLSHHEFLLGKLLVILCLSVFSVVTVAGAGLVLGYQHTSDVDFSLVVAKADFLNGFFVETFTYLSLAMLIAFLVRKSGLAIGLFMLYSMIIEHLIAMQLPDQITRFFPIKVVNRLIQAPIYQYLDPSKVQQHVALEAIALGMAYCLLFAYGTYLLLRKRDL